MSKFVFMLFTWPVGLIVISQIILVGFKLDPYALAVHEMLIILLLLLLMVSAVFYVFSSVVVTSPAIHTAWYAVRVSFAAFFSVIFLIAPIYSSNAIENRIVIWGGVIGVIALVVVGTVSAYRRFSLHKVSLQ